MAVSQRVSIVALVACLVLGACGGDGGPSGDASAECVAPKPLAKTPELPARLPLIEGLELTEARVERSSMTVEGVEEASVRDVYERLRTSVDEHGYRTVSFDFEGFEAEIFFSRGSAEAGALRLRRGPCNRQVTVTLLYDPIDTPAGRRILETARARLGDQER